MKPACCGLVMAGFVALALPCHAQNQRLRFDHLTVDDGLSNAWVQSILKDSRGFLWFGTQDGLNRYDGDSFKIFRHDPQDSNSLPSSVAAVLMEDSKKRLWVGSGWGNAGVALYDREHDFFKRFLPNPGQTGGGNNVRAVIEDRQGQLWLGTDNGIARLDPETGTITRFPLIPDSHIGVLQGIVGSLFEDREGRLWVGGIAGLLRFDRRLGQYTRWPGPNGELAALDHVEIGDLFEDKEGALWVATVGEGLYRVDASTARGTRYLPDPDDPESISNARVRRMVADGQGRLYVGTENGGLDILDLSTRKFAHNRPDAEDTTSLRSGSIWSMRLDDQGILWIGTYNTGVDYISPAAQRFQWLRARRGGLSDSHVSAVLEDRLGNLWVGTDGGGLNKLDRKTGTFGYYRHDSKDSTTIGSNAVWALLEDSQRRLWVGGWDGGLGVLDPASGRFTRFRHDSADPTSITSDNVWRILELSTGELLIATQTGADLFDRKSRVFTRVAERYPGASEGVVYSAAEDKQGNIWLAGTSFVDYVDRRKGSTSRHPSDPQDPKSLGVGWTQAVGVDSVGNVWLGGEGGLTCVAANTKEVRRYTTADGLPNSTITNIVEDHSGNLWLGTHHGLSKLVDAIRLPPKPIFVNFDVHDGLQGNDFARNASFRGRSGEMFFGGSAGLNSFDPRRIERNSYVPPVVLTGFKIFNKTVPITAQGSPLERTITETSDLTLSYRDSMVTFEFAALNFVVPQKNQYAYKLEGFDSAWNEVGGQRSATYTNLPHGAFTLRVRGSNNDGVWNDEGVSLAVRVRPPFWRANWFFAAAALTLVGAAGGVHGLRIRQHIRAERQLQERVTTALADIKTLRGLLPMCAWCKKIRDDTGYWNQLEKYVSERTDAEFSHGICPECLPKVREAP